MPAGPDPIRRTWSAPRQEMLLETSRLEPWHEEVYSQEAMTDSRRTDPVVEAYKRDLDRTLIRRNLKLSVEERILQAMELQRLADEVRRAGDQQRKRV